MQDLRQLHKQALPIFPLPKIRKKSSCAAHADGIRLLIRNRQKQYISIHPACPVRMIVRPDFLFPRTSP